MALGKSDRSSKSLDAALKGPSGSPPDGDTPPARRSYGKWIMIGFIAFALGVMLLDFVDFDSTPTVEQRDLYARREDCEQDWGTSDDKCEPVRSGDNIGHFYGPHYIPRMGYGGIGGYPGTYGSGAPVPGGLAPGASGLAPQATGPARSLDEAMARGRLGPAGSPTSTGGAPIVGGSTAPSGVAAPSSTATSSGLSAPRSGSHAMGSVHVSRGGFGSFGSHFSGGG